MFKYHKIFIQFFNPYKYDHFCGKYYCSGHLCEYLCSVLQFLFAVGAFARPDVSELGYQYRNPVNSYEAPSGSIENLNQRKYYHVDERTFHSPATNFETPIREHTSFTNTFGVNNGALSTQTLQTSGNLPISPYPLNSGTNNFGVNSGALSGNLGTQTLRTSGSLPTSPFSLNGGNVNVGAKVTSQSVNTGFPTFSQKFSGESSFATGGSSATFGQGQFETSQNNYNLNVNSGQTELSKHLYFYTAPEEHDVIRPRINYLSGPNKKNVKIIFIKAPSSTIGGPITIPALPQNEEKTVVYVLVKKQDEQALINVETAQASKPTKPEVFFIKYKTQQEAEDAVSKVQNGITPEGVLQNANSLEGDHEFISTIRQDNVNYGDVRDFDLRSHSGENSASVSSGESSEEVGHGSLNINTGIRGSSGVSATATGTHFVVGQTSGTSTNSRQPYTGFNGYQEVSSAAPAFSGSVQVTSTAAPSAAPAVHALYGPPRQ